VTTDGCRVLAHGLSDVTCYQALLDVLHSRRWSHEDLGHLTWRNALRVLHGG
jgi:microsomal dipeptidase-like Zn-dependent dipeptidase